MDLHSGIKQFGGISKASICRFNSSLRFGGSTSRKSSQISVIDLTKFLCWVKKSYRFCSCGFNQLRLMLGRFLRFGASGGSVLGGKVPLFVVAPFRFSCSFGFSAKATGAAADFFTGDVLPSSCNTNVRISSDISAIVCPGPLGEGEISGGAGATASALRRYRKRYQPLKQSSLLSYRNPALKIFFIRSLKFVLASAVLVMDFKVKRMLWIVNDVYL